jgi:hypothetical protein
MGRKEVECQHSTPHTPYPLPTDLTSDVRSGFHLVGAIHELPLRGGTRIAQTPIESLRTISIANITRSVGNA